MKTPKKIGAVHSPPLSIMNGAPVQTWQALTFCCGRSCAAGNRLGSERCFLVQNETSPWSLSSVSAPIHSFPPVLSPGHTHPFARLQWTWMDMVAMDHPECSNQNTWNKPVVLLQLPVITLPLVWFVHCWCEEFLLTFLWGAIEIISKDKLSQARKVVEIQLYPSSSCTAANTQGITDLCRTKMTEWNGERQSRTCQVLSSQSLLEQTQQLWLSFITIETFQAFQA